MNRSALPRLALAGIVSLSIPSAVDAFECPPGAPPICAPAAVIEVVVPNLLSTVAPGDAPLVLRTTTLITNAWFDAIAPYSGWTGIYSNLGNLPGGDSERNIALLYASHEVLLSLMPQFAADWDGILVGFGLDPHDDVIDDSPAGVGNRAGAALVAAREHDGMNQLGDANGSLYNRRPYADSTGYTPVNKGERLINPRRWQPDTLTTGNGLFVTQQFVTPQWAETQPYSYSEPTLTAPFPWKSYAVRPNGAALPPYKAQADEVLAVQAALTDRQKLLAEFFDDKIHSLGFSTLAATLALGLDLEQFVQLDFLVNAAAFDTGITVWDNKRRYDAVRPFSAIAYLYPETTITAWGGPGEGTVTDITGAEWRPYLQTANHPEYPSASASFCRAHATATRLYLEQIIGLAPDAANNLSYWTPAIPIAGAPLSVPTGKSLIEPGVTPAADTILGWDTWDEFSEDCGISRLWGGVHFFDSIPAGQDIGEQIGTEVFNWLKARIVGTSGE
ncbi:hypothetical protein CKO41_10400 [Thiococcus pfennigii]|nr:hypothetical protein [Thiococcus pfennigii]MBK1732191.1 hypothetical protein [Thiococcus pfennigii]